MTDHICEPTRVREHRSLERFYVGCSHVGPMTGPCSLDVFDVRIPLASLTRYWAYAGVMYVLCGDC